MLRKITACLISFCFIFEQSCFAQIAGPLGAPAYLHNPVPPADKFRPVHLRALSFDQAKNNFDLLLDKGDSQDIDQPEISAAAEKLLEYFRIGVNLPNDKFWVNLRPDAPDDIIDPLLEKTDIGKIMLEADLQLKKAVALFTSPDTAEGKAYWKKLYLKIDELFSPEEEAQVPTMTRPWIVPGEIIIGSAPDGVYIYKAGLKVMLEQDYLKTESAAAFSDPRIKELNEYSSELVREMIIPRLTREVNSSRKYADLRQVYYSLIFSQWFKQRATSSGKFDTNDLSGLTSRSSWSKDTYYQAYRKSFTEGEYNKEEEVQAPGGVYVQRYFSGGISIGSLPEFSTIYLDSIQGKLSRFSGELISLARDENGKIGFPDIGGLFSSRARLPEVDNRIDYRKAAEWLNAFDPGQREIAEHLLNNIQYYDLQEFKAAMLLTLNDFKSRIGERQYAIFDAGDESGEWCRRIARDEGWLAQAGAVKRADLAAWLGKNKEVGDLVILNDASYSGAQLITTIKIINRELDRLGRKITLHILIPFMNSEVENDLATDKELLSEKADNLRLLFSRYTKIKNIKEIFAGREDLYKEYRSIFQARDEEYDRTHTITYFQHKIPDAASTLTFEKLYRGRDLEPERAALLEGGVFDNRGNLKDIKPFIPRTIPPYRSSREYDRYLKELGSDPVWSQRVMADGGKKEEQIRLLLEESGKYSGRERSNPEKFFGAFADLSFYAAEKFKNLFRAKLSPEEIVAAEFEAFRKQDDFYGVEVYDRDGDLLAARYDGYSRGWNLDLVKHIGRLIDQNISADSLKRGEDFTEIPLGGGVIILAGERFDRGLIPDDPIARDGGFLRRIKNVLSADSRPRKAVLLPPEPALKQLKDCLEATRGQGGIGGGGYQDKTIVDLREAMRSNKVKEVILVGDLHARLENLKKVLNANDNLRKIVKGETVLLILGDAVHNEGNTAEILREMETSVETMQFVMDLKGRNPRSVYYLLGNHDFLDKGAYKGEIAQNEEFRAKLLEKYGQGYVDRYNDFISNSPIMAVGQGFAATHAGPAKTAGLEDIKNADVMSENGPLAMQVLWGRLEGGKDRDYTLPDVDNFLSRIGQPGGALIVGHSPEEKGEWHWEKAVNHAVIYGADRNIGYARITGEGKKDFIDCTAASSDLDLELSQFIYSKIDQDISPASEEGKAIVQLGRWLARSLNDYYSETSYSESMRRAGDSPRAVIEALAGLSADEEEAVRKDMLEGTFSIGKTKEGPVLIRKAVPLSEGKLILQDEVRRHDQLVFIVSGFVGVGKSTFATDALVETISAVVNEERIRKSKGESEDAAELAGMIGKGGKNILEDVQRNGKEFGIYEGILAADTVFRAKDQLDLSHGLRVHLIGDKKTRFANVQARNGGINLFEDGFSDLRGKVELDAALRGGGHDGESVPESVMAQEADLVIDVSVAYRDGGALEKKMEEMGIKKILRIDVSGEGFEKDALKAIGDGKAVALDLHNLDLGQDPNGAAKRFFDLSRALGKAFGPDRDNPALKDALIPPGWDINEILKNAFIHGNGGRTGLPIYLSVELGKDTGSGQVAIRSVKVIDNAVPPEEADAAVVSHDRQFGQGMGINFIKTQYEFELEKIIVNGKQAGTAVTISDRKRDGGKEDKKVAGIDFRALPVGVQPGGSQVNPASDLSALRKLAMNSRIKDLDQEWEQIEKQSRSAEMPYQKIKEYVAVCFRQADQEKLIRVSGFISEVLRSEEDNALPTAPELKELLALVESLDLTKGQNG